MTRILSLLTAAVLIFLPGTAGAQDAKTAKIAALQAEQEQAIERVVAIVNQPVHHYPRRSWAPIYTQGWFHPGAEAPDFDHVDIRQSQQFPYEKQDYVTSTLNPTEMFYGPELEFNAMTKYFYTDRTVPKKRLTEDEMLEINSLYASSAGTNRNSTRSRVALREQQMAPRPGIFSCRYWSFWD